MYLWYKFCAMKFAFILLYPAIPYLSIHIKVKKLWRVQKTEVCNDFDTIFACLWAKAPKRFVVDEQLAGPKRCPSNLPSKLPVMRQNEFRFENFDPFSISINFRPDSFRLIQSISALDVYPLGTTGMSTL